MDQEHIYSESEIFRVLGALRSVSNALPWYLRWTLRGWTAAIDAIAGALCSTHAQHLVQEAAALALFQTEE